MLRVFHPFSKPRLVFCSTWYCSISDFSIYKKKKSISNFSIYQKNLFYFSFQFFIPIAKGFPSLSPAKTGILQYSVLFNFKFFNINYKKKINFKFFNIQKKSISNFSIYNFFFFFFFFSIFYPHC